MEAIFAPSDHQTISPYKKQIKNQSKRNNSSSSRGLISRPIENLAPSNNNNIIHGGGLFFPPPPRALSFSYPPAVGLYPIQQRQGQQPPLLPLPVSTIRSLNSRTRDLSCPPTTTRKTNRTRDHSLTPKKSKQPIPRNEEPKQNSKPLIIASTVPSGPEPNDLPKDVSKVLSSSSSSFITGNNNNNNTHGTKDLESLTGSVFTLSPPPSSLPLPKFSVRPKLSCTAEAAGIDAGATDNLRRLLRLR
ncbi:uncharacterized protein LOC8274687 [Ricinus communis]|uniref:Uncharacterized protein n=1 Tax=Ricinus communis TaxID=3988 RepID=B9R8B7_RICCO|nr:uncharacterized protein LOC8274687 [Ricinus communis]EEF52747.1 hypothetical protein RCOM_1598450 [Ricinus communis]|eukprot:XP_002510560.1 uncharacterized protein LOC8274687 [Ricinus communis]